MSIFDPPQIATGNAAAAMAQQEWKARMELLSQAAPPPDYYKMVANYRPTVTVPQGFADWYAIGNELH